MKNFFKISKVQILGFSSFRKKT